MTSYASARFGQDLYGAQTPHPYRAKSDKLMWILQIDWEESGDFDSQIESQSIQSLKIQRGRQTLLDAALGGIAQPDDENFTITLIDPEGRYDPFNPASPAYTSAATTKALRVALVSTTTRLPAITVFVGCLTQIKYDNLNGIATLQGSGNHTLLQKPITAPNQPYSGNAWDPVFIRDGSTPFPINYWRGRSGGLGLAACVGIIAGLAGWERPLQISPASPNEQQPEYLLVDGKSAWQTLKQVCAAFVASITFQRNGSLLILDADDGVGSAAGNPPPSGALQRFGLQRSSPFTALRNQIEVAINPLGVPAFASPTPSNAYGVGWLGSGPIKVLPGEELFFDVPFSHSSGRTYQGNFARVNSDSPTEDSPLRVNSQVDGLGVNMGAATGNGEAEFSLVSKLIGTSSSGNIYTQAGGDQSRCRIRLKNWSSTRIAYFFNLRVLVIGLSDAGDQPALTTQYSNQESITLNGTQPLLFNNPLVQSANFAQEYARRALRMFQNRERASISRLRYIWQEQAVAEALASYDLGDHLDLTPTSASSFGLSGRQLVVGESLEWLSPDGQALMADLWFQKAQPQQVQVQLTSNAASTSAASLTWQHNGSQSGSLLLVQVATRGIGQASAVSAGGVALTRIGSTTLSTPHVELWALSGAPATNTPISITLTQADHVMATALSLTNADATTPFGSQYQAQAISTAGSISAPMQNGDLLVGVIASQGLISPTSGTQVSSLSSDGTWHASTVIAGESSLAAIAWSAPASGFAAFALVVRAKWH